MRYLTKVIGVFGFLCIVFVTLSNAQDDDSECGPVPQLYGGAQGYVLPGFVVRVRDSPATSGRQLGELFGGTFFTVVDGYRCSGGYNWWQIERSNLTGWIVDGDTTNYYVEPAEQTDVSATSLAWSPDSRWLGVGTDGGAWLFEPRMRNDEPRRIGRPANDVGFRSPDEFAVVLPLQPNDEYGFSYYDPDTGQLIDQALTGWEGMSQRPADPAYQAVYYGIDPPMYGYRETRWIVVVDGNREIYLTQFEDGSSAVDLALHPDGSAALVRHTTENGGRAAIHRLGASLTLTRLDVGLDVTHIALSADGEKLAVAGTDGQVLVGDWDDARDLEQSRTFDSEIQALALSPDGLLLAVVADDSLIVVDAETLENINILTDQTPAVDLAFSPDGLWLAALTAETLQVFFVPQYESEIYYTFP